MANLLFHLGLLSLHDLFQAKKGKTYRILMFHRILDKEGDSYDYSHPGIVVFKATLAKQMRFLADRYNVISFDKLVEALKIGRKLPPKTVVITFDDGWRDNYLNAYPVLKNHNLPAIIFLSTCFLENNKLFWPETLNYLIGQGKSGVQHLGLTLRELSQKVKDPLQRRILQSLLDVYQHPLKRIELMKRIDPDLREEIFCSLKRYFSRADDGIQSRRWSLTWEEAMEMAEDGITFGSHGVSHEPLPLLGKPEIMKELFDSKKIIEKRLRANVRFFAYPNGDYNTETQRLAQAAGYEAACTTGRGWSSDNLFEMERIGVHDSISTGLRGKFSGAMFACLVAGIWSLSEGEPR